MSHGSSLVVGMLAHSGAIGYLSLPVNGASEHHHHSHKMTMHGSQETLVQFYVHHWPEPNQAHMYVCTFALP